MTNRLLQEQFLQLTLTVVLVTILVGCKPDEPVVKHRIPKSRSGLEALREPVKVAANSGAPNSTQEVSDRMVVGLYELDEATWFLKINGPLARVDATEDQWLPFLEKVTFEKGQPVFDLPDGWSVGKDKPMRYKTLNIGDQKPPLELAISSLGPNQDLVLNVNRWRGQLGLDGISKSELGRNLKKRVDAATSFWYFDIRGKSSGGGMMPPFANRGSQSPSGQGRAPFAGQAAPQTRPANAGLKFDAPEGWKAGKTSGMVPVRFAKTADGKQAQITIVQMPAAANEWAPNAKRWAGEVGLSKLTEEELNSRTSDVTVDGITGQLLDLTQKDVDEAEKATIAGMVKRDGVAWFLKLTGDQSVVAESKEAFTKFVESLKFPN
jgi:hypothetical protein